MKDKVLIKLIVPEIDETYDLFLPINKKIGTIIKLINKAVFDLSVGDYKGSTNNFIYNYDTGDRYDINLLLSETDIKNGSKIVLI